MDEPTKDIPTEENGIRSTDISGSTTDKLASTGGSPTTTGGDSSNPVPTSIQPATPEPQPGNNGNTNRVLGDRIEESNKTGETREQEAKEIAKRFFYKKASVPSGGQNIGNSGSSFFRRLRFIHYLLVILVLITLYLAFVPRVQAPTVSPMPKKIPVCIQPTPITTPTPLIPTPTVRVVRPVFPTRVFTTP